MSTVLNKIKIYGLELTKNIKNSDVVYTQPGSLKYLLYGPQISEQSTSIKFGKVGELLFMEMIKYNKDLKLLYCGCHVIDDEGKKKDLDLLWADHKLKVIYYREAKGNIEMDTEKVPAMINKINSEVKKYVTEKYPDYTINIGVLSWSVYDRSNLKKGISHINKIENKKKTGFDLFTVAELKELCKENQLRHTGKKSEIIDRLRKCDKLTEPTPEEVDLVNEGIKVDHFEDFLKLVGIDWPEEDFYSYFRELGDILK